MKILYDHQIFEQQKFGGISRYFCEVIKGLTELGNAKLDVSIKYSKNEYLRKSIFAHKANDDPGAQGRWLLAWLKAYS